MKNEIDWEGEAQDWLVARGITRGIKDECSRSLARFLKETAEIHADQRTEEIAKALEKEVAGDVCVTGHHSQWHYGHVHGLRTAVTRARSFLSKKSTREEVLEEALRKIVAQDDGRPFPELHSIEIAREALEWKQ